MNIIDELIESYTYNGSVSMKALEDDIATLENQLDSFRSTLEEVRLRRKNEGPILTKIRDTKIRLSLLKATEKKVKEQMSSDSALLNMLGVSGQRANEVDETTTAANGKEPKPQNFDMAEAEIVSEEPEDVVLDDVKIEKPVNIDMESGEVVIDNRLNDDGIEYYIPDREKKEIEFSGTTVKVEVQKDKDINASVKIGETSQIDDTEQVDAEEQKEDENSVQPSPEQEEETPVEIVDIDKTPEPVTNPGFVTQIEIEVPEGEEEASSFVPETEGSEIVLEVECENGEAPDLEIEEEACEEDETHELFTHADFMPDVVDEIAPPPSLEDYFEPIDGYTSCIEYAPENGWPSTVYDAFYDDTPEIYASVDLSNLTNMVNTENIYPSIDHAKKKLYLHFNDIRDYEVFLELVRLYKKNRWWDRLFVKNRPTIFMTVRNGTEIWDFALNNCRVIEVSDSEFSIVTCPRQTHDFYAVIEYSDRTLIHGTTNKKEHQDEEDYQETGGEEDAS